MQALGTEQPGAVCIPAKASLFADGGTLVTARDRDRNPDVVEGVPPAAPRVGLTGAGRRRIGCRIVHDDREELMRAMSSNLNVQARPCSMLAG